MKLTIPLLQLSGTPPLSNTSSDLEDDTEESEFDTEENGGGLSDSSSTTVEDDENQLQQLQITTFIWRCHY